MANGLIERVTVSEVKELITIPKYGTISFSFNSGGIYYMLYNPGATVSITDIPTAVDGIVTMTFVAPTGLMGVPTTFNVNGSAKTIKWAGGTTPSASSGTMTYWTYSIIVINNAVAYVNGSKATFG